MRKLLLLTALIGFSFYINAQVDTVLYEDFEAPSLEDKIDTTYSKKLIGTSTASYPFSRTTLVATSGVNSYKAEGAGGFASFFQTISFSTVNKRYTFLQFNHIAKVSTLNQCLLQYSIDGGQNWQQITGNEYRGNSKAFEATGFFNESSYFTLGDPWRTGVYVGNNSVPKNSWWRAESFNISDLVYNVAANTGYPNVMIRWEMRLTSSTGTGAIPAGWFVDDITVTQANCELDPPVTLFGYDPIPCYYYNPEENIPAQPGDKYAIGIQAYDASGIDSVFLYWRKTFPPGLPFQKKTIPLYSAADTLYQDTLYNIFVGDTIEYYYVVYDGSCPNMTKNPAIGANFKFWPEPALPVKCGPNTCDQFPELITVVPEWVEDFETPRWTAGNGGASTTGNAHRGVFPVFYPNGNWTVTPAVDPNLANRYAWCVNSGGTATLATGPSTNHTTGGAKYIYAESSLGSPVTSTQFITPCIDLSNETRCLALEFWYHMFGSDVDLLRIDIDSGSNTADWVVNYAKVVGQQQSTSNAAWKKMIVPLGDFNGKYIRIRFFAVKRIPGDRGDIAIDDLRIYEPDSVDMEVLSLNEPKNGYCYFDNNEPVEIHIRNNGCQTATTIPVAFQVTSALNPTGVTKWDTIQTSLILGDTLTYVFTPPADLSSYDTYWVRAWTAMPGDVKPGNDMASVEDSIEYTLPITSFPYIEDFEDGIRQLQILGNDRMRFMPGVIPTYRWLINSGLTPSLGASGPFQGFGYGGKYLYSESIINDNNASKTYIRTVCVDLGSMTAPVIEFYYHMFGPSIESLEIEVSRAEEDLDTWTAVPGSKITGGTQQTSSLADWKYKKVDLSGYLGETVKIRFVASRKKLTDPDEDLVDIAIDKVMIFDEIANDAGVISINSPDLHATTGSIIDPSIKLTNHGSANFTSVPVSIRITQLCGPNAGQSTMYNDVVTSSIGRGATTGVITLSNANIPVPDGEFEICVITQLAGDTHAFNDTICKRLIGHGIDTIAYKTSFDDCNYSKDGFYFEGSFRQWELGQPTGTRIRNAYSSPNAWVTNLDGIVIPGTSEYLYTPDVVNFDTVVKVSLRFRHNMDFAAASDAKTSKAVGAIQYREILNGVEGPWKYVGKDVLGTVIRGVNNLNWYDSEFGSVLLNQIGDNPGFVGRTNGAWIQTTFALTSLDETPGSKRFRFLYQTAPDGSKSNEGWGIDDFELYIPPQNSIGIIRITHEAPIAFPNVTQTLKLTIRNTGAKFLDSADIKIIIDDVNVVVDTRYIPSPPMYTGKTETLRFQDVWQAQDVTVGLHKVEVLTSLPNGKNDNLTIDDDTIVYFTVLDTVDLRASSGVTSYCNDFERNNPDIHPWLATNTYVYQDGKQSWQWGFPNQFGLPPSGQNAWVTGLDDDYVFRDSSSLLSPIFLIDSGQGLNVKFEHWFRTEALHDGGNFEVSMDGGQSWQPIGFVFNGDSAVNWYNTPFVAALNIIRPGWSGDSEGWIKSNWPFSFDHDVQCIFRFHFESDYDNQDNGWAIDDFCLEHNDSLIVRQIIGTNESPLINESITSELSPNPTKGMAELGLYLPSPKDGKMVIVNSVGQIMEQRDLRLENGNNRLELNGSAWESGLYIVKLYIDETVITKKLIIAH